MVLAAAISAYPSPGVRTANPETQISFRGAPAAKLGPITVSGSRSGNHAGRLLQHSDGQGASFVPDRPFVSGERVTVRTGLDVAGATKGDYGFTIGRRPAAKHPRAANLPGVGHGAVQHFATRTDLAPPAVAVTTSKAGQAPGDVFVAPKGGRGQDGPMILDDAGHVVWFKPAGDRDEATDFRTQTYEGKPVLTWWQGRLIGGYGNGEGVIYDDRYQPIRRVRAGNGYSADLHEFQLTPQGTALLIAYDPVKEDGRIVVDAVVQEIDVATGLVEFEWHSIGNVSLDESYEPKPGPRAEWDYMHLNSVDLDAGGDFIVSARHTSTVYSISRATGRILWRLGGKASDFKAGPGVRFDFQHDARMQPDGTLTIFDNSSSPPRRTASRAITVALDTTAHKAMLVKSLTHPGPLLSATQGSVEPLATGGTFVGFGSQRFFTEYDAQGRIVFDGRLSRGNDTYRAFRLPWTGTPASRPRLVAHRGSGSSVTVRASWNGETGIARWLVQAGSSARSLRPITTVPSTGFETSAIITRASYVTMTALDASGTPLGTSVAVQPH
jgi:hypothetical protein